MSNYHLVSTLHATRVELADAHKAGDAAAVAAAEAQVAAARAAVDAALADGRVASDKHLLDLDFDCLGVILSHLGPKDALSTSHTCTTLRAALFRGGLPGPLAGVCKKRGNQFRPIHFPNAADKAAALRALVGMEPALGALRLDFQFEMFDEGDARMLARALDKAPRATRIDITLEGLGCYEDDKPDRLVHILSSHDRAFAAPLQVHLKRVDSNGTGEVLRLIRAGVCVASIDWSVDLPDFDSRLAANTLTRLHVEVRDTFNMSTRFPALRCLNLCILEPENFAIDVPSLTELAPRLKEIEIESILYYDGHDNFEPPTHGFGIEPRRFAQFLATIKGVTRVCFGPDLYVTLTQNENVNLGQLTALRKLRDLEISCSNTFVALEPRSSHPGPLHAPVAEDAITNLPPLPRGLTRLAFSRRARVAFCHPLPGLRVLDWRGSSPNVSCTTFYRHEDDDGGVSAQRLVERDHLDVPLSVPSPAIAPNLHTLLIGYDTMEEIPGDFDLWTLVAARTALRVVVIEYARLLCSAPDGFDATPAGFSALLEREAKDLVSVHTHNCVIEGAHQQAVENFLRTLEQRGGRVCRAGFEECLFCMLHDGTDLWPQDVYPY